MIKLLLGQQNTYTKNQLFICLWDSPTQIETLDPAKLASERFFGRSGKKCDLIVFGSQRKHHQLVLAYKIRANEAVYQTPDKQGS